MQLNNRQFWLLSIPVFFIAPAIFYWGVITYFHFDLFHPDWLWPAYNQYLLSILDGRLDVPLEAIGGEGWLVGDKVYMYHGVLPAIARLLVYPFVDLEIVSVSRLFIWLWTTAAVFVLLWVLIRKYLTTKRLNSQFFVLLLASIVLWFGSAHLSIVQNGSIYQEPYAASLFLVSCYLAIFANDIVFKQKPIIFRLKTYALLAALIVHARPNIAVFLYMLTVWMIFFSVYVELKEKRTGRIFENKLETLLLLFSRGIVPMLILLAGGLILLFMNYLRFGDPLAMAGGAYGYLILEGDSMKFCGYQKSGSFNALRILPHSLFYLFGDYGSYKFLSNYFGLGYVSKGVPETRLVVSWAVSFITLVCMMIFYLRPVAWSTFRGRLLGAFLLIALLSTLPIFAYGTIEYRYSADLWMPFGLSILWSFDWLLRNYDKVDRFVTGFRKLPVIALAVFLTLAGPLYTMSHYELAYFNQTRRAGSYDNKSDTFVPHFDDLRKLREPVPLDIFKSCN